MYDRSGWLSRVVLSDLNGLVKIHDWERQDGESVVAFDAFVVYRDIGTDRSLRLVAQKVAKSLPLMKRWCARWQWGVRIEAWTHHEDRARQSGYLKGVRDMSERQARQAMTAASALLSPAAAVIKRIQKANKEGEDPFESLSLEKLINLVESVAPMIIQMLEAERVARGLPPAGGSGSGGVNVMIDQSLHSTTNEAFFHQQVLTDPKFGRDATALLGRLEDVGKSQPGGLREVGK